MIEDYAQRSTAAQPTILSFTTTNSASQNSQSQVTLWLLEELGIDYNLNLFERETSGPRKNRAPESLKDTHPLGKSPQLITPEGRVIIERTAIAKYLIDKYDTAGKFKLNIDDTENDAVREEELLSFGGSSLSTIMMVQLILKFIGDGSPFFIRPLFRSAFGMLNKAFTGPEIDQMMKYADSNLKGREYFMGTSNPTRVDFCFLWYIDLFKMAGNSDLSPYPDLKAWYDRCKARDAWKRSLEKGNGYDMNVEI